MAKSSGSLEWPVFFWKRTVCQNDSIASQLLWWTPIIIFCCQLRLVIQSAFYELFSIPIKLESGFQFRIFLQPLSNESIQSWSVFNGWMKTVCFYLWCSVVSFADNVKGAIKQCGDCLIGLRGRSDCALEEMVQNWVLGSNISTCCVSAVQARCQAAYVARHCVFTENMVQINPPEIQVFVGQIQAAHHILWVLNFGKPRTIHNHWW